MANKKQVKKEVEEKPVVKQVSNLADLVKKALDNGMVSDRSMRVALRAAL